MDAGTRPGEPTPARAAIVLGALGVVFGDIGTSPLYTLQMAGASVSGPDDILGVLSLIFWGLTVVIGVKYLAFIMRADNRGEGGILALLALVLGLEGVPLPHEPVHALDDVDGHPDRPRLVRERAGDRLANPPGRVRRELEALAVVELLRATDEADGALLDQVEKR